MSKIDVSFENNVLILHKQSSRKSDHDTEKYQIDALEIGKQYRSKMRVTRECDKNKILFWKNIESILEDDMLEDEELEKDKIKKQPVLVVFSDEERIKFMYCSMEKAYRILLKLKYKVLGISLNKRRVKIRVLAYLINKYNMKIR